MGWSRVGDAVRRLGGIAPWWSGCLLVVAGAACLAGGRHLPAGVLLAATTAPVDGPPVDLPSADVGSGLVGGAVVAAALVVALWRVVLRLLLVGLVALGLIGLAVVVAPRAQAATPGVADAAVPGSGPLSVITLVVGLAAVFVVGLLLGEQWHRHQVVRRERQLAQAHRELAALARGRRDRGVEPERRARGTA